CTKAVYYTSGWSNPFDSW
nr:immunoglobulin heavy chain junction region [Macaca mulatta]MOV53914.1 immunoglobulin heavy chain junction region [Macaca mulatta]MOV57445.1 immunoglobulin heavy chain junction region [Macaca mulatta]MOV59090.1 immunoglobulin heavy chain junction region [Macaca mulatta]MOV59946.1 immunoglobulin heavy chain junction region [Macaca mulatta]